MRFLKEKKGIMISFIIGVIIASSITVYATNYFAKDISYTKPGTQTAISVETALNELFSKNNSNTTITSETINGVGSVNYTFQDDFRAACVYIYDGYNSGSTWTTTCENSEEISSKDWVSDLGYTRYILLQNIKKDDVITASHSGSSWGVNLYIVFIK